MTESERKLYDLHIEYTRRFGVDDDLYSFMVPAYMSDDKFRIRLYERCLRENKPVSAFIKKPKFKPNVEY